MKMEKGSYSLATQIAAATTACFMNRFGKPPSAIISAGVGTCPEKYIWELFYPNVLKIGIDPIDKSFKWSGVFVHAALVGDESVDKISFSTRFKSVYSPRGKIEVPAITLDNALVDYDIGNQALLWMDCEGSEWEVIRGGSKTLDRVEWINCEIKTHINYDAPDGDLVEEELLRRGFELYYEHTCSRDRIYRRKQ